MPHDSRAQPSYAWTSRGGDRVRVRRIKGGQPGWRLRVRDPRTGRQHEKTFYGTERQANQELAHWRKELTSAASPLRPRAGSVTLGEWAVEWLGAYQWKVPPAGDFEGVARPNSTWANARDMLALYLLPALGPDRKLRSVTAADLSEAIGSLKRRDGAKLAGSSKETVAGTARALFRDAVKAGLLVVSPAEHLQTRWDVKTTSRSHLIPSIRSVERLAAAMDRTWAMPAWAADLRGPNGEGKGDLVRLIAYTGMRFEELAGLRAEDVDLRRRSIRIRRTATESGGRRELREGGKSSAAMRELVILDQAVAPIQRLEAVRRRGRELEEGREARRAVRKDRGAYPLLPVEQRWTLLVSGERGGYQSYGHWRKRLELAYQELRREAAVAGPNVDVDHEYSAHELRHVAASILISTPDIRDVEVMEQMGHSSIAVTRRVYGHLFRLDKSELAARISRQVEVISLQEQEAFGMRED